MTAKMKAIKDRLKQLERESDGALFPAAVVEAARRPEDILHAEFEWDDSKAAHAHRLDMARHLIRTHRYVEEVTQVEMPARHYTSITISQDEKAYVSLDRLKTNIDWARESMNDEIRRIEAALFRARSMADVLGLSNELESAIVRFVALRERLAA